MQSAPPETVSVRRAASEDDLTAASMPMHTRTDNLCCRHDRGAVDLPNGSRRPLERSFKRPNGGALGAIIARHLLGASRYGCYVKPRAASEGGATPRNRTIPPPSVGLVVACTF
jgi:hypothetical protein